MRGSAVSDSRGPRGASPLAIAALGLIGEGASAADLERRFLERGASLAADVAAGILEDLAGLGLVRVARRASERQEFVLTTLGQRIAASALTGAAAVELEDLERLRTDLLSTIAHEVRTPLTVVRTSAGLLLDPASKPTAEQRRTMIETIGRNADRMQRLIDEILDLARFRSGAIRLQLRRFDARDLAGSAVAAVAPLAALRGQHLAIRADAAAATRVYGDHRRLERALVNLVSNAQRFSPDGATVDVAIFREGDTVRWSVTDRGPGIPEDDQPRLFERFFVGRSDRHGRAEGTGLGLPTALAIAQAHGGSIEVESRPGLGSTFALAVPIDGPDGSAEDAG
jgi:signal transduction histidine kinase